MKLREYLKEDRRTSTWFSQQLGVTKSTLSKWVTGKRKPSRPYIYMIEQKTDGQVTSKDWDEENNENSNNT